MASRRYKSLYLEAGYTHREHRSKKGRRYRRSYDLTRKKKINALKDKESKVEIEKLKNK